MNTESYRPGGQEKLSAVFFANGLGDHVLTLPTLRALARVLPTRLALVTAEGPAEFFFGDVGIDRCVQVPMERSGLDAARCFSAEEVARRLGPVECLISLVPWHSPSLSDLIERARPAWSIGLHPDFDFCFPVDADAHSADCSFQMVNKFAPGQRLSDFVRPFALPPWSVAAAEDVRRAAGVGRRLLVVHEETATETKRWDAARLRETLRALTDAHPDLFVIVASRNPPRFRIDDLGESVVAITRVSLPFFVALIAHADFFLGVDSVGLHVADLWNVPGIGLFGPTKPEKWGFRFSSDGIHVDGRGSMHNISVEQVVSAFGSLLTRRP